MWNFSATSGIRRISFISTIYLLCCVEFGNLVYKDRRHAPSQTAWLCFPLRNDFIWIREWKLLYLDKKGDLLGLFLSGSYFLLCIWWESFARGWENRMHLSLLQEATELRMSGPAEDGSQDLHGNVGNPKKQNTVEKAAPAVSLCLCRELQSAFCCCSGVVAALLTAWLHRVASLQSEFFPARPFFLRCTVKHLKVKV